MTSVQERLQINPVSMDEWSTREQLCLASAVSCNGDQNWMNVSRSLKQVCGANRPADWFSQKSCAVQYEELLENADPAKKNKPSTGEVAATGNASADLIIRRLKEERVQELKVEIRREQEEYAKVYGELKAVQSGQLSEDEITEMWKEIEKEQEMHRIEEMKLENQLREREQNKQDMQRNWRTNVGTSLTPIYVSQKVEDNLQEIIGSSKPTTSGTQQQQATSPLLTSLLKSPTPGSAAIALGNTAHVTSPTITTLLTGGAIIQNQPAITLKNSIPANEAVQLLTRPISGPPIESLSSIPSGTQNLLSPSQSAPTLSMLLEKSKIPAPSSLKAASTHITTSSSVPLEPIKEKKISSLASDSNNEEVPMDIEEDVVASTSCSADLLDADDSDADANEEQQLLEVFKNIGNIDELEDIDVAAVINEEVDFLKSVGDEAVDDVEEIDFEDQSVQQSKNLVKGHTQQDKPLKSIKNVENELSEVTVKKANTKVETISSDDSNDNIPLATLGSNNSHDTKEVGKVMGQKDKQLNESLSKGKDAIILTHPDDDESSQSENSKDLKELKNLLSQKSPTSESSEVIIIPTDDESSGDKQRTQQKDKDKQVDGEDTEAVEEDIATEPEKHKDMNPTLILDTLQDASNSTASKSKDFVLGTHEAPPTISLADTDEDSSETTDISIKIDEKMLILEKLSAQLKRGSEEPKAEGSKFLDEDSTLGEMTAKPQAIRKLRDRDRSESPIPTLDDDTTTASDHSVTQRLRRRYSSTPLIDSIPTSPASSDRDDRDIKTFKKYLLSLYNALMVSKHAAGFQHALNEHAEKFKYICNSCTDFQLIKKNIETGAIRNVYELQRDVFLLCQNAIMVFETNSLNYKLACAFMKDCENIKDFISNGNKAAASKLDKDKETRLSTSSSHSSGVKVRGSSRKSQRIT